MKTTRSHVYDFFLRKLKETQSVIVDRVPGKGFLSTTLSINSKNQHKLTVFSFSTNSQNIYAPRLSQVAAMHDVKTALLLSSLP